MTLYDALSHASALHREGRFAEAKAAYRDILRQTPNQFDALHLLGVLALQSGDPVKGLAWIDKAIAERSDVSIAHKHRGMGLEALGRDTEALSAYERAVALNADYAEAWANHGHLLLQRQNNEAALRSLDKALALQPGLPLAAVDRAVALHRLQRYAESAAAHRRVLAICDATLATDPRNAPTHVMRGLASHALGAEQDAVASYDKALDAVPDYPEAHYNRGIALMCLGRREEGLQAYDRALALRPGYLDAMLAKAHALLLLGRLEEGWRYYEWRKQSIERPGDRAFPQPLWLGEQPIAGKHLFVHWEQGYGDIVQMCRYTSILYDMGAKVTLSVPVGLLPLMRGFDRRISIIGGAAVPPAFDFHCPLMSLPMALGTTVATIPAMPRYLSADTEASARWKAWLGPDPRPKIGLVWRGNPSRHYNRVRSIPLPDILGILDDRRRWICLQHELDDEDAEAVRQDGRIEFLGGKIQDIGETAALVENLDAVISIDTFFAHLAGALGKPLFLPLAYAPDWRWLVDRPDSPWYPSARLFRQQTMGDWSSVLRDIADSLPTER